MDRLVHLLKDNQVGIWCKRAAWIVLVLNLVSLLLRIYATASLYSSTSPFPTSVEWLDTLQYVFSYVIQGLFYFFILYAAAIAVEYLAGSVQEEEEEEEEEEEITEPGISK